MSLHWQAVARLGTQSVKAARLDNGHGLQAKLMSYGATLLEMWVPDGHGRLVDVCLGFDSPAEYFNLHPYFGAVIGRYANRIAGARFTLDGIDYRLQANDGPHHLHGGAKGFDKVVWTALGERTDDLPEVRWRHVSAAGDEGYPGKLEVDVDYGLSDDVLRIDYAAMSDAATFINLTHHAYWNLAGEGDILGHELQIFGRRFLPVDSGLIPTGEMREVRGSAMDFLSPMAIGERIATGASDPQLRAANGGFDHCWVLDRTGPGLELAARLRDPVSGRAMEIWTTQPGLQFYSGNFLDGSWRGKGGRHYAKHAGLCLETQHFPDSPHHPEFPSTLLRSDDSYRQSTVYRFLTST
jgi:aldose 1-epimerase